MKTKLRLTSPIFNPQAAREALSQAVRANTLELESEIKRAQAESVPRGKIYRRGRITKVTKRALKRLGYRTFKTVNNKERLIVGYKFHRASAPGQVPAVDTGNYVNSINSDTTQLLKGVVRTNARQAGRLENTRPHFKPALDRQKPKFLADLDQAINLLIK